LHFTIQEQIMVAVAIPDSQAKFYREFLMGRHKWEPKDYGIDLSRTDLIDLFIDELRSVYRGMWTIDELVVHPRDAVRFCDDFRMKHGFYDLPDDIILRTLMNLRKAQTTGQRKN